MSYNKHLGFCAALVAIFVIDNPQCGRYDINRKQLAAAYLESSRYDQALTEIERAMRQQGDDATLLLFAALAHMGSRANDLALEALLKGLELEPDNGSLHETLRDLTRQTQHYAQTQHDLEQLRLEHPQSASLLTTLAWTHAHQDEQNKAIALLDSAILFDPELLFARLELSQLLMEQERFAAAEKELEAALDIEGNNPRLLIALGECQLSQGHHEAADSTFQQALERRSATGAIATRIAQLYYRRGMRYKTIEYYERAIARDPDNAFVLNNLAWTYAEEAMHLQHAAELSLRAIKIDGENPVYLDTFAELLYLQKKYRRAFAVIRRAVALEPENGEHWIYLQGQYDKMRRALVQTAQLP